MTGTFAPEDIYRSVTTDRDGMPPHMALDNAAPCTVDLWDLEAKPERKPPEGWQAPVDSVSAISPEVKLADRIQREIAALVARGETTGAGADRRRLSYGDMLVLVRRRGKTFDATIKALKHAGIPVAGADRLKLTEHIAIIDMLALGDALLLPQDDLALATALKSPLFGLSEDQLFALAHDRKSLSLHDALRLRSDGDPLLQQASKRLGEAQVRARSDTPFDFYAWLLGADGGRKRILQRLGAEANDAIDEFLELALTFERRGTASLQGFLGWLRESDTDIKRDMEIARDEVRVMTVHGAKGLEAAVVFLADTTVTPTDNQRLALIHLRTGNDAPGSPVLTVWAGKKADDPARVTAARSTMQDDTNDEYRRLLYVAMTRAADRLIIGGCQPGNRSDISKSWYALARDGLRRSGLHEATLTEADGGSGLRFTRPDDPASQGDPPAVAPAQAPAAIPTWLNSPAPALPSLPNLLRPSGPTDQRRRKSGEAGQIAGAKAKQRGNLVHRLLQSLPDLPAASRRAAATDYLRRNAPDLSGSEQGDIAEQMLDLLQDQRFALLFGSGSRAEVPIAGRIGESTISGQIDRLVIMPDDILIADYKTNADPPSAPEQVPQAYVRQLALYRHVLSKLYPGRPVRAVLIWTETLEIMEIPAELLDHEIAPLILS